MKWWKYHEMGNKNGNNNNNCLLRCVGMESGNENEGCCMIPCECMPVLPALVDKGN